MNKLLQEIKDEWKKHTDMEALLKEIGFPNAGRTIKIAIILYGILTLFGIAMIIVWLKS